jgi:hypothetical protein
MPNGMFDPLGTKYIRERDPWADSELFLSPDAVYATRELTFIDQYHELKDRLTNNPVPTAEEWNMGAYKEELEPQVRDAAMAMRLKGYNTGSSGFWGHDHVDQAMDIATPIDDNAKARLAEHMIEVTDKGVRFTPENPSNLDSIKKTWDMVADILSDLGKHADPAENHGAYMCRYATKHKMNDFYLEDWIWQAGAFSGSNTPLAMALIHEGRSFDDDVHAPQREAEARHWQVAKQAQLQLEAEDEEHRKNR